VVSLVAALTLRSQPYIAENTVIKRLPSNAKLVVLEGDIAKSKVGAQNQWLKVRDIEGREGYVAAWYVSLAEDPALGARATPAEKPDKPKALIVRTSVESVTLRTQPAIAQETVIKLLPLNTELRVLEDSLPETKIGMQNQWLQVQDLHGTEGYVAAWLVKKSG
jgi:SH3-like domain-containing protein